MVGVLGIWAPSPAVSPYLYDNMTGQKGGIIPTHKCVYHIPKKNSGKIFWKIGVFIIKNIL
jgi:hypothetical protein